MVWGLHLSMRRELIIGFNHFSVSPGDLVRLADAPDGTHRFGFCWQRDQDAIILHWIAAQESAKYLQAP